MNTNASQRTQYFGFPLFAEEDKLSILTDWNGTIEELDNILEDYRIRISGCEQISTSFMDKVILLRNEISAVMDRIQSDENVTATQGREIDELQSSLITMGETIKRILIHLTTHDSLISNNKEDIEDLDASIEANTTAIRGLDDRLTPAESNVSTLQDDVESILSNIDTLYGRVSNLDTQISNLSSNLSDTQNDVEYLMGHDDHTKDISDILFGSGSPMVSIILPISYSHIIAPTSGTYKALVLNELNASTCISPSFITELDVSKALGSDDNLGTTFLNQFGTMFAGYSLGFFTFKSIGGDDSIDEDNLGDVGDKVYVKNPGFYNKATSATFDKFVYNFVDSDFIEVGTIIQKDAIGGGKHKYTVEPNRKFINCLPAYVSNETVEKAEGPFRDIDYTARNGFWFSLNRYDLAEGAVTPCVKGLYVGDGSTFKQVLGEIEGNINLKYVVIPKFYIRED